MFDDYKILEENVCLKKEIEEIIKNSKNNDIFNFQDEPDKFQKKPTKYNFSFIILILFPIILIFGIKYFYHPKPQSISATSQKDNTSFNYNDNIKSEEKSKKESTESSPKNNNEEIINNFKINTLSANISLRNADNEFLKLFEINGEENNTYIKREENVLKLLETYLNTDSDLKEVLQDFNPELAIVYKEILSKFKNNPELKEIFRNAQRKWVTYKATLMEAVKDILPKKEGDLIIMYIDSERLEYLKNINAKVDILYNTFNFENMTYQKYYNKLYNFSINIPDNNFIILENLKEKISLYHNLHQDIIIEIFGRNNEYSSLEEEYNYKIDIHYDSLGYNLLKKNFYVVTYEKGNNAVYEKTMYDFTNKIFVTLLLEFPQEYKEEISPLIDKMVKSMKFE